MRVCLNLRLDRFLNIECPPANRQSKRPIPREPPRLLSRRVPRQILPHPSPPSPADFSACP